MATKIKTSLTTGFSNFLKDDSMHIELNRFKLGYLSRDQSLSSLDNNGYPSYSLSSAAPTSGYYNFGMISLGNNKYQISFIISKYNLSLQDNDSFVMLIYGKDLNTEIIFPAILIQSESNGEINFTDETNILTITLTSPICSLLYYPEDSYTRDLEQSSPLNIYSLQDLPSSESEYLTSRYSYESALSDLSFNGGSDDLNNNLDRFGFRQFT